ncbi:MAG: zinc ribbon domain-containing protein [Chloroflexi bacterium]|nr:MAG: zinc ribbon domain-containing protein [Chloroflexota bacterium]MBL1195400.1 zinc ribbon domain-containing protein [Chloroflexota bacterium]NOH12683.1 zinc ribbon domain-containing protein [Chloroflexota bacterium]
MYSWDEDTSTWYGSGSYSYGPGGSSARSAAAARAKASGPRTYEKRGKPNEKIIDPKKHITTESSNPLIIAVDVTGSMASWPFEIFDRLPLLYNTLSQYREDLEICFAAIGDARVDQWPLQVTDFSSGFDLEQLLGSLYGEGGGGDAPESYGLFAHWVNTHVKVPSLSEAPFMIVFGDVYMHPQVSKSAISHYLGDKVDKDVDAIKAWQQVIQTWNTWFLRRPHGKPGDKVDQQWGQAVGEQKVFHITDKQRAVDYAMGLVARSWGHFGDFQDNMRARQSEDKVSEISKPIEMICPRCGAPIPVDAGGMFTCSYCGTTLKI